MVIIDLKIGRKLTESDKICKKIILPWGKKILARRMEMPNRTDVDQK